jgi:hypothetical protein
MVFAKSKNIINTIKLVISRNTEIRMHGVKYLFYFSLISVANKEIYET